MTYAVGGLIQATDINGFVSTNTPNFNNIWSTGSSNSGYGQTALDTVAVGDLIAENPWNNLVTNIGKSASHQGTAITAITPPVTGNRIDFFSALTTNLGLINTNRLNAAAQGGTTTSVSTTTDTWSDTLTVTFTVAFASQNAARYFFNAGGQIGISCSHPSTGTPTINQLINDLCSDAGTTWLSSPTSGTVTLSGTAYSGVTKVGGANPGGSTISTNNGFYALGTTSTELAKQFSDFDPTNKYGSQYGPNTFLSISAASNGAGTITFTILYDEVPNGAVVSAGTETTLTVRSPSTSELTNSWGTPSLSNSYVAVTAPTIAPVIQTVSAPTGSAMTPTQTLVGSNFGGAVTYSINPVLPTGLTMDTSTGVISGTATTVQLAAPYIITGTGAISGTATSTVSIAVVSAAIETLIVSGGGGSSSDVAAGGGGGGISIGSFTLAPGSFTVVVGAGGAGTFRSSGGTGGVTSITGTAINFSTPGGGGGGGYGGAGGASGNGTEGGGFGGGGFGGDWFSGGGGGAGAAGGGGGGNGGVGLQFLAWTTPTGTGADGGYFSGGGGGGNSNGNGPSPRGGGLGGLGGAGFGGDRWPDQAVENSGTPGAANSGGGAGGTATNGYFTGPSGGSGVVIIRYDGSPRATGGTIVENGGKTYHTFTTSGTFTIT